MTGCIGGRGRGREGVKKRERILLYLHVSLLKINTMEAIRSHRQLIVYKLAFELSMEIYWITRTFPKEEIYSLTSQILGSSRSVSANLAEAFRKRKYEKAFIAKLTDSEGEAAETQVWLDYSLECAFIERETYLRLNSEYEKVIGMLVNMMKHPEKWSF